MQSFPLRILVIEDHADLAANLGDYLSARGHVMDFASDGVTGHALASSGDYDAVILDVMLPRMDGFDVCRRLRGEGNGTPILMLTARGQLDDRLDGFDAGADDYVTKPFSLQEIDARVRALHRRAQPNSASLLRVGDLELDLRTLAARRGGAPLELAPGPRKLLAELMRASPNVVPKRRLEVVLWGDDPPGEDALRAQVCALRRAVDRPFERPLVHTVHGVGYRVCDGDEASTHE